MTTEEILRKKADAEIEIYSILRNYEEETGMVINDLIFETHNAVLETGTVVDSSYSVTIKTK